jgi:hypothetical protein
MPKEMQRITHDITAERILSGESLITLKDSDTLLRYDKAKGLYIPDGEAFLRTKVEKFMAAADQSEFTSNNYVREVIGHIRRLKR